MHGIAADGEGRLYVAGDDGLALYSTDGSLIRQQPTERAGLCVAVDETGRVFVGEEGQIEVFGTDGSRERRWDDAERLGRVTNIGFHKGEVLVADAKAPCIRRFRSGGEWINDIGTPGSARGFLIPNGVLDFDIDEAGVVHAANPAKHRIERYSLEGERLGHFGRWGHTEEDFSGCCNPTNLALLYDGRVVVSEKADARVKIYTPDGKLAVVIASEEFDKLSKNMDLAIDRHGRVYVLDTGRSCTHIFELVAEERKEPAVP